MARKDWDAEGLRELFAMLDHAHGLMREVLEGMDGGKLPSLHTHADTVKNLHLPAVEQWAMTIKADYDKQLVAFARGQAAAKTKGKRGKK